MKKISFLLIIFISLIFNGCRKDMICTCESTTVSTSPNGTSTTISTDTKTLLKVTKSEGRVNCLSKKYIFTYYTILGDSIADTDIKCTLN